MSNKADISCKQAVPNNGLNFLGTYGNSSLGSSVTPAILNAGIYAFDLLATMTEDCLFLDVYVPGKVIKTPGLKLSVVNWIYGGGVSFIFSRIAIHSADLI
jgi:hypothetical protein